MGLFKKFYYLVGGVSPELFEKFQDETEVKKEGSTTSSFFAPIMHFNKNWIETYIHSVIEEEGKDVLRNIRYIANVPFISNEWRDELTKELSKDPIETTSEDDFVGIPNIKKIIMRKMNWTNIYKEREEPVQIEIIFNDEEDNKSTSLSCIPSYRDYENIKDIVRPHTLFKKNVNYLDSRYWKEELVKLKKRDEEDLYIILKMIQNSSEILIKRTMDNIASKGIEKYDYNESFITLSYNVEFNKKYNGLSIRRISDREICDGDLRFINKRIDIIDITSIKITNNFVALASQSISGGFYYGIGEVYKTENEEVTFLISFKIKKEYMEEIKNVRVR